MSRCGGSRRRNIVGIVAIGLVASVTGSTIVAQASAPPSTVAEPAGSGRCIVRLHGKSGTGGDSYVENDVLNVFPDGNAEGWGGRQWIYFPEEQYEAAREIVDEAIETAGCSDVIIDGFSNGAAFAAKLYCRGDTFDGRVFRFVADDPVPDEGVLACEPAAGTEVVLYWTGALESTAQPGWSCREADWTCEGGVTIGIERYAETLGVDVLPSRFSEHEWYWDAPELSDWTRPDPETSVPPSSSPATDA